MATGLKSELSKKQLMYRESCDCTYFTCSHLEKIYTFQCKKASKCISQNVPLTCIIYFKT